MHLLEVVGAVVKSLDVLPVEVLREGLGGRGQVVVRALPDSDRDGLAREIGMGDTARALQDLFEDEAAACREALKERTRERVPLAWATTQDNLGSALRSLGER